MSRQDRLGYIAAVKRLASLPPQTRSNIAAGVRSHYDDFLAAHIIQAPLVHFTGSLLPFHRTLVWAYEQALRNECGYKGAQPYWDWPLYYENLTASPLFDGSDTSLGGNGEYIPHGGTPVRAFGLEVDLPPGTGGGNVTTGPFAYWTVCQQSTFFPFASMPVHLPPTYPTNPHPLGEPRRHAPPLPPQHHRPPAHRRPLHPQRHRRSKPPLQPPQPHAGLPTQPKHGHDLPCRGASPQLRGHHLLPQAYRRLGSRRPEGVWPGAVTASEWPFHDGRAAE